MASDQPSDEKGEKLTDNLPRHIKEESIGFSSNQGKGNDLIANFMEKYCEPDRYSEIRRSISKNFVLAKNKVIPKLDSVPRAKKTQLSLREKRELGLYKLSRKGLKYQECLKLNELWRQYMLDSLDFPEFGKKTGEMDTRDKEWEQLATQLYKADCHGAVLTVVRSRCPSLVGLRGIVVMDTKNTFKVLSTDNIVRTIPKETSVFQFELDQFRINVYGRHLRVKPAERCSKKVRNYLSLDL